jgi:hypothetical protein
MRLRHLAASLVMLMSGVVLAQQDVAFRIGVATLDTSGGCVAIAGRAVAAGSRLIFVYVPPPTAPDAPTVIEGEVAAPSTRGDPGCPATARQGDGRVLHGVTSSTAGAARGCVLRAGRRT